MTHKTKRTFAYGAGLGLALLLFAAPVAPSAEEGEFNATERQAIETLVREYLLENPELIVEVLDKYYAEREARIVAESRQAIKDNWDLLANDPGSYSVGRPDAKVTVVEFFDYNCGYCRGATPTLLNALEENDELRVVFREFPIRGKASEDIARISMATMNQGKYLEYHTLLMQAEGQLTVERAWDFARELELDVKQLKKDAESPALDEIITQNEKLAEALYIDGTPSFIIGEEVIRGWPGAKTFNDLVAYNQNGGEDEPEIESN